MILSKNILIIISLIVLGTREIKAVLESHDKDARTVILDSESSTEIVMNPTIEEKLIKRCVDILENNGFNHNFPGIINYAIISHNRNYEKYFSQDLKDLYDYAEHLVTSNINASLYIYGYDKWCNSDFSDDAGFDSLKLCEAYVKKFPHLNSTRGLDNMYLSYFRYSSYDWTDIGAAFGYMVYLESQLFSLKLQQLFQSAQDWCSYSYDTRIDIEGCKNQLQTMGFKWGTPGIINSIHLDRFDWPKGKLNDKISANTIVRNYVNDLILADINKIIIYGPEEWLKEDLKITQFSDEDEKNTYINEFRKSYIQHYNLNNEDGRENLYQTYWRYTKFDYEMELENDKANYYYSHLKHYMAMSSNISLKTPDWCEKKYKKN